MPSGGRKLDPETAAAKGKRQDGTKAQVGLENAVELWATPRASENENRTTKHAPSHGNGHGKTLAGEVMSWQTPRGHEAGQYQNQKDGTRIATLTGQVIAGQHAPENGSTTGRPQELWQTPKASKVEGYASAGFAETLCQQVTGETKPVGKMLNPDWVEQLMGLPTGWTDCGCAATASSPKPQPLPS